MFAKKCGDNIFRDAEIVYSNEWSSVSRIYLERGNDTKEIFTTNFGRRSAVILLEENQILLMSQYRLLISDYSWEIPGGKVEPEESFEDAAIRECQEETGFVCRSVLPLISFHPGLDTLYNPTCIFLCKDFYKGRETDTHETEEVKWFSVDEIATLLGSGYFQDSLTIIGLQALILRIL